MMPSLVRKPSRPRVALAAGFAAAVAAISIVFADPVSPISLAIVDSPDPVASGAELTYTITAVNTGGAKVDNVVLNTQLNGVGGIGVPPQFVLTSSRGSCTQTVDLVSCSAGSVEGGGTWVVTIRGIVTASSGTTLNNTATISFNKSAQNFTSTATATTLVQGGGGGTELADLSVDKTGPTAVPISSPMTYTLIVNNTGAVNATDVKVVDTLPPGLSDVSYSTTSLFVCTDDEPALPHASVVVTVTCTGGLVNAGANGSITINATSPDASSVITNTASVDPDNTIAEKNELNNTSSLVNTTVGNPPQQGPLTIVKSDVDLQLGVPDWSDGAGFDPIVPGAILTYKVLVTNVSAFRADDVRLVDGTQGLAAASMTITQEVTDGSVGVHGGCQVDAPQLTCSIKSLNAGGTVLYTIKGQVVASAGSTLINTATASGNIKNVGHSATATELTTVRPSVDLTVTKADGPDPVCASSWPTTAEGGAEAPPASPPLLAPPVCLGGLKYTIVVGNSGINPALGVLVRDQLPGGTIFDHVSGDTAAFSGGCSMGAGNILSCTGGTIPAASTKTLFVWVVAPPFVGTIVNSVVVDPVNTIFESDETNNGAVQATTVSTGVDLTLVKDDKAPNSPQGFDPIATSGTQTYVITVDNIGPQSVSNVRVRDTLPAGTIFRNAQGDSGFTCSHAGGIVDCIGGYLPGTFEEFYTDAGEHKARITIKVFAQPIVGVMHNEVRVDPDNQIAEINEQNNIDFEDTQVGNGGHDQGAFNEFIITKDQTSPLPVGVAVARNAKVTYEIKVKNDGTDPASGVQVRDFLPAGARYIEATGTNHFLCSQVSNYIDCLGGELGAFGSGTEQATITVTMFAPDTPGDYVNQAIVDPLGAKPEGNEFNNQDNEPLKVANGGIGAFNDLTISKTSDPGTVKPKQQYKYLLTITNQGLKPALNVAARDVLPAGVVYVSAQDTTAGSPSSAFTCGESGGVVDCTGATLDGTDNDLGVVPEARTIQITVKAPNQNTTLLNQAFVDPQNLVPEGDELNNSATATTTVQSVINLTIHKDGPTESDQSQVSKYTIKIENKAPEGGGAGEDAFGVAMTDPLPVGLIPLAVTADQNFACSVAENPINLVNCLGDLGTGQTVTITVDVFMTAEGGRSLDNQACVDPADTIEEFNENDNCSTFSTLSGVETPKLKPDLVVVKSVSPSSPATAGQPITYTVSIVNGGTAKAKGPLTLTDTMPANVTFINYTATNGWTCTFASPDLTCHEPPSPTGGDGLEVGASATITIEATYDGNATSPIVNTAKADKALVEPGPDDTHEDETNLDNNTATAKNSVGSTGIDLVVSTMTDNPDPVDRGQALTYVAVVVNGGTQDSTDTGEQVVVKFDAPQNGATYVSGAGSNGFNCDATANLNHEIFCRGDLPAGGETTITLKFAVLLGAPDDLVLAATVDPDNEITESNEGNNADSETTTVTGQTCQGIACVDLVAAQVTGSPEPYPNNGTVTFSYVLVNVGDTATALDPDPAHNQRLTHFDVSGAFTSFTRTVTPTNPASVITCENDPSSIPGSTVLSNCYGNLGAGEGVIITIKLTGVTSNTASAGALADPFGLITEKVETNNSASKTVHKQP